MMRTFLPRWFDGDVDLEAIDPNNPQFLSEDQSPPQAGDEVDIRPCWVPRRGDEYYFSADKQEVLIRQMLPDLKCHRLHGNWGWLVVD